MKAESKMWAVLYLMHLIFPIGSAEPMDHCCTFWLKKMLLFFSEMATDNDYCHHGDGAVSLAFFLFALCCHRPFSSGSRSSSLLSPVMVTLDLLFRIYWGNTSKPCWHYQRCSEKTKRHLQKAAVNAFQNVCNVLFAESTEVRSHNVDTPVKMTPCWLALHGFMMKSSASIHPHMCSSNI